MVQVAHQGAGAPKPAPGRHSNAPIKPESQSILSKIVARRLGLFPQFNGAFAFEHVKCPPCRRVQHTGDKFWLLAGADSDKGASHHGSICPLPSSYPIATLRQIKTVHAGCR